MITIQATYAIDLLDLRKAYLATLTAPLDGMWESAFVAMAPHYALMLEDRQIGYCCINSDQTLLQFYLKPQYRRYSQAALGLLISSGKVLEASAGTNEPDFLSLCLDHQQGVAVHTLLYHDALPLHIDLPQYGDPVLRPVEPQEVNRIASFVVDSTGKGGGWLKPYLTMLVSRIEMYALERDGVLLGTGENRVSVNQPPYSDLGVIVGREYRGKGIAPYILAQLKGDCYRRGLKPICSTTVDNLPSQRAIAKAGFLPHYRLLKIRFR